jgi:hypothetical protein
MKKIKLTYLKVCYWLDYKLGPFVVNERKYGRYLQSLLDQQDEIQRLESDIKSKIN